MEEKQIETAEEMKQAIDNMFDSMLKAAKEYGTKTYDNNCDKCLYADKICLYSGSKEFLCLNGRDKDTHEKFHKLKFNDDYPKGVKSITIKRDKPMVFIPYDEVKNGK
jgi:hypothetical protein